MNYKGVEAKYRGLLQGFRYAAATNHWRKETKHNCASSPLRSREIPQWIENVRSNALLNKVVRKVLQFGCAKCMKWHSVCLWWRRKLCWRAEPVYICMQWSNSGNTKKKKAFRSEIHKLTVHYSWNKEDLP